GLVKNYSGAIAARVFLGVAEAGFFPAAVFISSVWYPRKQVQWRIAIFYCMGSLSGSFTGLIAYGVAHMDGRAGLAAWRWIFILEGLITVAFAPLIIWILPSPSDSKWLSDDEKELLSSICSSGGVSPHVAFRKESLYAAFKDVKVWMVGMMGVGTVLPLYGGHLWRVPSTVIVDQGKRAMSSALELTMANISAAIGTNIFLGREAPNYPTGFGISLFTVGLGIVLAGLLWWMLARENERRDKLDKAAVARLSPAEIEEMGDSAPTFRYIL
ncbi:hypothetical protein EHS25_001697, partial [Saitozyma podzolica]